MVNMIINITQNTVLPSLPHLIFLIKVPFSLSSLSLKLSLKKERKKEID